ncbi:ferredoxin--NADP reductase [Halospeciosus flavus]|uniref:ferredoxin--NADP reductase n=1 Tax=Halospeciosus flavus TaxID=3032283 RepID=UPI0036090114
MTRSGHEECFDQRPDGDLEIEWDRVLAAANEGAIAGEAAGALRSLKERIDRPYPALVRIDLELDDPLDFLPGQYVAISYEGTPRAYSLAGPPGHDSITLCIRRIPGGTLTSELFTTLSEGDEVTVRGPYGDMVLHEPVPRDLAFLATGTGVAPFKSMVDHVFERGLDTVEGYERDIWVFLGCAWEDDLAFREHFRDLDATHENFHFVPTLSREPYLTDWKGRPTTSSTPWRSTSTETPSRSTRFPRIYPYVEAGPTQDVDARLDPGRLDVYACGVSAMVSSLVDYATAMGVPDDRVEGEGFG